MPRFCWHLYSGNTIHDGASYTYDGRNRLLTAEDTIGGSVKYTYDSLGRLLTRSASQLLLADSFAQGASGWQTTAPKWSAVTANGDPAIEADGLDFATAARKNAGASDFSLSARVKVVSTSNTTVTATAGLVFRSDLPVSGADANEYYFGIYPDQSQWKLWKVTNGGFGSAPVASGTATFTKGRFYTLSARAQGGQIEVSIDGQIVTTYTDGVPYTHTYVGLRSCNAVTVFDDVRVTGLTYGPATVYRYSDTSGELLNELDENGNVTVSHILESDGDAIGAVRGADRYYYSFNAHGDVIALTDAQGNLIASFTYDAWGAPTELSASGAKVPVGSWAGTPGQGLFLLFGGMLYDAATGLYLTRTRAYNPRTGRFMQRDILDESPKDGYTGFPFGKDAIGTNLYAWCLNNPTNMVDPSGEWGFIDSIRNKVSAGYNWVKGKVSASYNWVVKKAKAAWAFARTQAARAKAMAAAAASRARAAAGAAASRARAAAAVAAASRAKAEAGSAVIVTGVFKHYTSPEKSNGLENAVYDFGSIGFGPLAIGAIANTAKDRYYGHIGSSRVAWNQGTTAAGAYKFFPAPMAAGFADVMEHADEKGWLDWINDKMRTDD